MEWMLEKKDLEKVQLLRYLQNLLGSEVLIKTVMSDLGWSRYLTLNVVKQLGDDLTEFYGLEPNGKASVYLADDDKSIMTYSSRQFNVDAITLVYLRQSVMWQFLKELFMETIDSYEDFAARNLTTIGTVRNVRMQLAEKLHEQDIYITEDYKLSGEESNVRVFVFRLAQRYFGDREFPWGDELLERANQAVDRIADRYMPRQYVRDTKRIALRFHYTIAYIRLSQGHALHEDVTAGYVVPTEKLDSVAGDFVAQATKEAEDVLGLQHDYAEYEARNTLMYMYGLGFYAGSDWYNNVSMLVRRHLDGAIAITAEYYQEYFHLTLPDDVAAQIKEYLMPPILTYMLFPNDSGARRYLVSSEAYRRYPILVEMAMNVSGHLGQLIAGENWRPAERYFFQNLFTIYAGLFDQKVIFKPIKVDIDINYRPGLELMLKNMIAGFPEFNVVFTNRFEDDVDLVISDAMLSDVDPDYRFDWSDMPNLRQIEQLRTRLGQLKRHKFEDSFTS